MTPINARQRLASTGFVAGLLLLLAGPGCAGSGGWGENRLRDLSDVVDVRYGTGFGLGLGLQFGDLFQTGLGCSIERYSRQWFGRKSVEVKNGLFASAVLITFDGDYLRRVGPGDDWIKRGNSTTGTFSLLILNLSGGAEQQFVGNEAWFTQPAGDAPLLTSVRVGGVLFLPGANGGLYLNLGEFADFIGGIFGGDPMNDDGLPKYFTPGGAAEPSDTPSAATDTPPSVSTDGPDS